MEVHAHAHTPRKKWTHYLWEFLMLFLAVFCGFLAETQREHMVERRRVNESMKQVVENLKYDSTRCVVNAIDNVKIALGLDSLRNEVKKAIAGQPDGNRLYYYMLRYTGDFGEAVFNSSAITELKSSGSLRLIANKKLVGDMADYYERKLYAARDYMPSRLQMTALQKTINDFFTLQDLDNYIRSYDTLVEKGFTNEYNYQEILEHQPALQLLNKDPKELAKLYTELTQFEMQVKKYNFWLYLIKDGSVKLSAEIRQEYHLE
jgi:hypothetical protein